LLLENVRTLCEKHGTNFHQLEKAVGFGNGTVSKWAVQTPSVERVKAVADYFGVTVDDLLKEDEND